MIEGNCLRCGKFKKPLTRMLCRNCYQRAIRHDKLDKYPKIRAGKRYDNCIVCGEYGHIQCKDKCKKCYCKWHFNQPGRKEKYNAQRRCARLENPEKYRARDRERSKTKNRKKWVTAHNKKYYEENAEEIKEYVRQWRQNNPDLIQLYSNEARARKKNAEGNTTLNQWKLLVEHYCPDDCCLCCGESFNSSDARKLLSMDHIRPLSIGGNNWPSNLQPLCHSCNSSKHLANTDYRPDGGEFARGLMC